MQERKELTTGKTIAWIIVLYMVFSTVLGLVYILVSKLLIQLISGSSIVSTIFYIIELIASLAMIYLSWRLSIVCTLKNRPVSGLDTKKIVRFLILFIVILQVILTIHDVYRIKTELDKYDEYEERFNDRDVIAALPQEKLQERLNEINEEKREIEKNTYPVMIAENVISLLINMLIMIIVSKKLLDKYNGITEMEEKIKR